MRPVDETGTSSDRVARAAWSILAEPGDPVAGALVRLVGAAGALAWLRSVAVADVGPRAWAALAERAGPLAVPDQQRVARGVARWAARLDGCSPDGALDALDRLGGTLVVPGDATWPPGLDDLGELAPFCLWVRGDPAAGNRPAGSVAVVGARASTRYGERVAFELADGVSRRGVGVVSGGAYGIDVAAHRGALADGGGTVVVLAGGVDRVYPAGNARLFEAVASGGGCLMSENPPGGLPTKSRFLQRNRLIAAVTRATVVVEAAWRSGALSTAHHAARLLRPVGAVPGPVTSVASAGCHRLLRDGVAVCVTDFAEVLELVGPVGSAPVVEPTVPSRPGDGLDLDTRRVLDALPVRRPVEVGALAAAAGVSTADVRGALGVLELIGSAERIDGGWRLSTRHERNTG